jgi:hypothetical protein
MENLASSTGLELIYVVTLSHKAMRLPQTYHGFSKDIAALASSDNYLSTAPTLLRDTYSATTSPRPNNAQGSAQGSDRAFGTGRSHFLLPGPQAC